MGTAIGVLLRAAVLVGVLVAWVEYADRSNPDDALGTGLIAFLLLVTISFAGSIVDGVRRGLVHALLVWTATALLAAVAVGAYLDDGLDDGFSGDMVDGTAFFGLLLLLPALVGSGVGGLFHRARAATGASSS